MLEFQASDSSQFLGNNLGKNGLMGTILKILLCKRATYSFIHSMRKYILNSCYVKYSAGI